MINPPLQRETRASGIDWLGEIPQHWEVQPARAAFRPKLVKNTGLLEQQVLSLSYGRILVKPEEKLRGLVPESFETYQVVDPGDIIVRTTDLQNDQTSLRIGYSRHRGIITSAYLNLTTTHRLTSEFGYQVLNAYDLLKIIYGYGSGLRQNLDFSHIKHMPVPIPPLEEQRAIVRFLDHVDRRIRRYVRAKQKLIRLLEEQKQAIIHRAVTRGLDPNVRLKPSGVEWLGDVPEHWEVCRVKQVARLESGHTPSRSNPLHWRDDNDIPWVSLNDTKALDASDYISETKYCINALGLQNSSARLLPSGVVVFTRDAAVGKAAITTRPMAVSQHLIAWVCGPRIVNEYLLRVFYAMRRELDRFTFGATIATIGMDDVGKLVTPVPPIAEQHVIAGHLATATRHLLGAIAQAQGALMAVREFRIRLIADVVTGKLDVREAAAGLGEVGGEAEEVEEGVGVEGEGSGQGECEGEGVEGEYAEGEDEGLMEVAEGSV